MVGMAGLKDPIGDPLICFTIIFMLSIILIYVVPLLRKYFLPHIYKHMPSVISHFT